MKRAGKYTGIIKPSVLQVSELYKNMVKGKGFFLWIWYIPKKCVGNLES